MAFFQNRKRRTWQKEPTLFTVGPRRVWGKNDVERSGLERSCERNVIRWFRRLRRRGTGRKDNYAQKIAKGWVAISPQIQKHQKSHRRRHAFVPRRYFPNRASNRRNLAQQQNDYHHYFYSLKRTLVQLHLFLQYCLFWWKVVIAFGRRRNWAEGFSFHYW